METPEKLLGAVRQFRHNTNEPDEFVFGFDHNEAVKVYNAALEREKELRQKLDTRDESLVHYQTELSLAEEREKVLEDWVKLTDCDCEYPDDPHCDRCVILAKVKAMREGKG